MRPILINVSAAFIAIAISFPGIGRADGADMFGKKCAGCHGKDAKAQTTMGKKLNIKDLTDPKVQAAAKDADWEKRIDEGATDAAGKSVMPGQKGKLSADEEKELVKYLRSLKGK